MKILHLIHNYYPSVGGSQDLFKNLSERLVRLYGDDVTVFTTNAMQSPHDRRVDLIETSEETVGGVRVRRFPFSRRPLPALRQAIRVGRKIHAPFTEELEILRSGPIAPRMFREAVSFDADVVAGTSARYLQAFYPRMAKLVGRKIPFICYGALHVKNGYVPRLVLRAVDGAQAYVAYTAYERDTLVENGADGERIHVVGLGVDVERFSRADGQAIRDEYGIGEAPVVAFIGRQAASKGIDKLVYAMRAVWEEIPSAVLLIAGSRTAYTTQLLNLIGRLPTPEQEKVIVINDFTEEEKPALFAACDVFVNVSEDESFGIVYLEAWASGKPVIGSKVGAVASVINHGHDGVLVGYGETAELSSAILDLLRDEKLRTFMARHGHDKVEREHTWDTVTRRLRTIYEQVQQNQSTRP